MYSVRAYVNTKNSENTLVIESSMHGIYEYKLNVGKNINPCVGYIKFPEDFIISVIYSHDCWSFAPIPLYKSSNNMEFVYIKYGKAKYVGSLELIMEYEKAADYKYEFEYVSNIE